MILIRKKYKHFPPIKLLQGSNFNGYSCHSHRLISFIGMLNDKINLLIKRRSLSKGVQKQKSWERK